MTLKSLLNELISTDRQQQECKQLADWLPYWSAKQLQYQSDGPFVSAVATATAADRMAWAFFSGYQGAVQATFKSQAAPGKVSAICVNEKGRKITEIETTLTRIGNESFINGKKSWSLGNVASLQLFVLAKNFDGPSKGPGSLTFVEIPNSAPGLQEEVRHDQGPVPELPHSEVTFSHVQVQEARIVPGDGYAHYAKPFRLREDIFVSAATLAYLLGEARKASWPTSWAQKCIGVISGLHACSSMNPDEAGTQILTAGALGLASQVIYESEFMWRHSDHEKLSRWHRDYALLSMGREARRQRSIKSWRSMGWKVPDHAGLGDHISGAMVVV